MREPEMVGREAGAVTSRGGGAVAGRYPTARTVDSFAPILAIGEPTNEPRGSTRCPAFGRCTILQLEYLTMAALELK